MNKDVKQEDLVPWLFVDMYMSYINSQFWYRAIYPNGKFGVLMRPCAKNSTRHIGERFQVKYDSNTNISGNEQFVYEIVEIDEYNNTVYYELVKT